MKKLTIVMLFAVILTLVSAKEYTVKSGDTLGKIARKNNTGYKTIAELNNLTDPNMIYEGQKLMLPEGKYKVNVFNEFFVKEEYADMFKDALVDSVEMMDMDKMMMKKADARFLENASDETSILFIGRGESEEDIEDLTYKFQEGKLGEIAAEAIEQEPTVSFVSPIFSTNGEYLKTPSKYRKPYILFYVFTVKEGKSWETIQELRKYLSRTRKERGTLLADLYALEGEGNENTFLIHQEFFTEKYYMNEHTMKSHTVNIEAFLDSVLDDDYEPMAYEFIEIEYNS